MNKELFKKWYREYRIADRNRDRLLEVYATEWDAAFTLHKSHRYATCQALIAQNYEKQRQIARDFILDIENGTL